MNSTDNAPHAPFLPEIFDLNTFQKQLEKPPLELIKGLFHQGSKGMLGGASKTNKTWCLIDVGLSVAYGKPFMGMETRQGRVLFVNLEIRPYFFRQRLKVVAAAKGIDLTKLSAFDVWNMRGHARKYTNFIPALVDKIKDKGYALVIIDPIYKIQGDSVENAAEEVGMLLESLESIPRDTGAGVLYSSHFAKGNAAGKESIDRVSGSGVFAREPDTIITLTKHEEENCYAVEVTLRDCPQMDPFVVRWAYPLMERDNSLDPAKLKTVGGRPTQYQPDDLVELLPDSGLSYKDWLKAATDSSSMSPTTFKRKLDVLKDDGVIKSLNGRWLKVDLETIFKNGSK